MPSLLETTNVYQNLQGRYGVRSWVHASAPTGFGYFDEFRRACPWPLLMAIVLCLLSMFLTMIVFASGRFFPDLVPTVSMNAPCRRTKPWSSWSHPSTTKWFSTDRRTLAWPSPLPTRSPWPSSRTSTGRLSVPRCTITTWRRTACATTCKRRILMRIIASTHERSEVRTSCEHAVFWLIGGVFYVSLNGQPPSPKIPPEKQRLARHPRLRLPGGLVNSSSMKKLPLPSATCRYQSAPLQAVGKPRALSPTS